MKETPKNRFCRKALKLAKRIKPLIGCKWWKRYTKEQKAILEDMCYMPEELIDFLLIDTIESKIDYFNSVDIWLILEFKTFNYKHPLKYKVGFMQLITKQINLQHDYLELKQKIGING
jgi:hypothetical protein